MVASLSFADLASSMEHAIKNSIVAVGASWSASSVASVIGIIADIAAKTKTRDLREHHSMIEDEKEAFLGHKVWCLMFEMPPSIMLLCGRLSFFVSLATHSR